jgi:hypothetical protein
LLPLLLANCYVFMIIAVRQFYLPNKPTAYLWGIVAASVAFAAYLIGCIWHGRLVWWDESNESQK